MTPWYEALTYLPRLQSFLQPLRYDQYYLRPAVSMRNDDGKSSDAGHKGSTKMVLKPGMKPAQEPGPAQSSHRASGAWEPGGTHALFQKTSLANSRNPFRATPPTGPRPKSHLNMLTNAQTPSGVADNIGSMNINDAETQNWNPDNKKYYDPSAGPTRSTATAPWRNTAAPSRTSSSRSARRACNTEYCVSSNYKRHDFFLGDVISVPFHTGNTNPNVKPDDENLTLTIVGPAYSKRRMMVVLYIYMQDMYCLPMYNFGDRGLKQKPEHLRKEYV